MVCLSSNNREDVLLEDLVLDASENPVQFKYFQRVASEMIHFLIFSHFWGFKKLGCGSLVDIVNHCKSHFMHCAPCFSEKACRLWISHLKCRNSLGTKAAHSRKGCIPRFQDTSMIRNGMNSSHVQTSHQKCPN